MKQTPVDNRYLEPAQHRTQRRPQHAAADGDVNVGSMRPNTSDAPDAEISATEAAQQVRAGTFLLDVREAHEWVAGHAPDAVHIPLSELNERAGELPADQSIICVCHIGGRSAMVTDALNRGGWQAVNLVGGMAAWQDAGLPVIDDQGNPGHIL